MRKALKCATVFLLIVSLAACAGREIVPLPVADDYDAVAEATPSGKLRVGLVPGAYSDMFTEIIQPALEEMGYKIEVILYENRSLPNIALARNQVDLNMFQHYTSLNNYKFENDAALSAIVEVPTAPMGIFSTKYESFQEIRYGASVSVPAESTDLARALVVLESAGLISLTPLKDKDTVTTDDIISNPRGLELIPAEAEEPAKSLSACELAVADGGYLVDGNLKLSDALYREVMNDNHMVVVAVRTKDLHAQFISDIIGIAGSEGYRTAIAAPDGAFAEFQRPPSFYK